MTLDDLGDFFQFLDDIAIHRTFLKADTDISAGVVSQFAGIYVISGADDDSHLYQALDALMNSGTGNAADDGHILGRDARVVHDNVEDLAVQIINFFHGVDKNG